MSKAVLSIITIAYNDLAGIQFTQRNIDYSISEIEHLIVDGGSTDDTVNYLRQQDGPQWTSEPDNGLYDAMNKGLSRAQGKYVIFMNSGDGFQTQETLPKILEILQTQKPDALYGETMFRDEDNSDLGIRSEVTTRTLPKELHWKKLIKGLLVCHQSFIIKRELVTQYMEDNLSADYDWIISGLKKSTHIVNANFIIASYLVGGISDQKKIQSLQDRWSIMQEHFGLFKTINAHILILFRFIRHTFCA